MRNLENVDPIFEELNCDITSAEVEKVITCLKRGKALLCGRYFVSASD